MKKLYRTLMMILALNMPEWLCAQYSYVDEMDLKWAIASVDVANNRLDISEYWAKGELGTNGKMYSRIAHWMDGAGEYPRKETNWGIRRENKCIYVYDYEKNTEKLAFDFNLSAGDGFTTYNGMKWMVEEAKDTLIKDPKSDGATIDVTRRLLKVRSEDGAIRDTWLEGFGSFKNHLMIMPIAAEDIRETLWQCEGYDFHISRELSCDPIYTHDTGWMGGTFDKDDNRKDTTFVYDNGVLTVEIQVCRWPARYYSCYFRSGTDIHRVWSWEFSPYIDSGEKKYYTDKFSFTGLPESKDGYRIHWGNGVTTGVNDVKADRAKRAEGGIYDLQGRKLPEEPRKGMYIKDGKVVMGEDARLP